MTLADLALIALLGAPLGFADDATQPADANKSNQVSIDRQGRPDVGPVQRAGALIGKSLHSADGKAVGKIADVALDLADGYVALLLVDAADAKGALALPLALVEFEVSEPKLEKRVGTRELESAPRVAANRWARDGNRAWAKDVFAHYGVKEPWVEAQRDGGNADKRQRAEQTPVGFALLTRLQGTSVVNGKGAPLGKIEDFAIAPRLALVAYAAVDHKAGSAETLLPIPLSAFVVKPGAKSWVLELPDDILANTPTIARRAWPEQIDRAWVEYVHVRYGRSPFGGVRDQLRAQAPATGENEGQAEDRVGRTQGVN